MQSITKIKQFILRYRHAWVLLYSFIYMPWFCYLEKHRFSHYYLIHSPLDDYIPFVEYFIVPYLLWFLFIAVTIAYFFFTDKKGYYQLTAFLFTGMTIFLIICTVFPASAHICERYCFYKTGTTALQHRYTDECTAKYSCI